MFVLIVEDEVINRTVYSAALAGLSGVSVVAVATVAETRAVLAHARPDVVVLDLNLPDGTGLDVIEDLERHGIVARVVVVSAYIDVYRARLLLNDRLVMISKPARADELRRLVEGNRPPSIPPPFGLVDYIQLACMGQHSVELLISTAGDGGLVRIQNGELWSARDATGTGVEALARLSSTSGSSIHVRGLGALDGTREIDDRWDHVLLEMMRLQDEASPARQSDPDELSDVVPEAQPELDFDTYVELGVKAIVHRDFPAAEVALEKALALRPDDRMVAHRLHRLREQSKRES